MRHEFIEQRLQNMRAFAEPMLEAHMILVAINAVFVESHAALPARIAQQCCEVIGLAQKVKTVFERVSHAYTKNGNERALSDTYSCSGIVVAVGKEVHSLRPGDMVACLGSRETWYADLACISEYEAVLLSSTEDYKKQAVAGYAVLALHAIQRAQLQVGHTVCVVGFNAFGYLIMQLAKLSGAQVIVVDDKAEQLQRARELGAAYVFHTSGTDWQTELLCITQRHGVDVTIIVDSTIKGLSPLHAITITRSHGRIVLVGLHDIFINHAIIGRKDIDFAVAAPHDSCYHDEQLGHYHSQVPFVQWRQRAGLQQMARLISTGSIDVEPLITRQWEVTQKITCPVMSHDADLGILIICQTTHDSFALSCADEKQTKKTTRSKLSGITRFVPAMRDSVRVGIIGADSFVQDTLLPTLVRLGDVTVKAIADIEYARAERVSKLFGVARTCQLDTDILNGDMVDAIIIAANTVYHTDRVTHALESNKAVFVQEPLATTFEQLERIKQALEERPHVPLCVDYHRSQAPFMQKIKSVLKKRSTPLIAHYRVNAKNNTLCDQKSTETGNILGDACHFVDLFCYLTDSQPVSVSVEAIHTMRDDVFPTDNFSAQISFADGSVCALLYTTLGHGHYGNEQLEIFFDAKTIVMRDFLTLQGFGLPAWFDETVSTPVVGRDLLIADFFAGLRENPIRTPISRERIIMVNTITLTIDRLACSGGGEQRL
jgi:predicted dehydrogenase/NADPH:quinone reductase-like Zn-dependent oxidoreductase